MIRAIVIALMIASAGSAAVGASEPEFSIEALEKKMDSQRTIAQEPDPRPSTYGVDLGPKEEAAKRGQYRRPPGPVRGGVIKVPHPGAAKGLMRINKDGSYQYRTALRPKSQAVSVRVGAMTPPIVRGQAAGLSYKSMYGSANLFALQADYEWVPFQGFGALGVQLGTGFATATGNGTLESGPPAEEKYTIFIVPLSAFALYRFEYVRRQWIVPYLNGGGTYYGLAEKRDDDAPFKFAGTMAVGGGGGVHFSISRLDPQGAFTLDREYGIADMWLTVEARVMQSLNQDLDFSNQMISVGVTTDF